jgi:hypothetical protein
MAVMEMGTVLLLLRVTLCVALVVPIGCAGNVRTVGENDGATTLPVP